MPLYEYKCQSCGAVIEALQKFSDEPLKVHENCGGQLERLLSPPAFQFKGSGFYITDYARGNGGHSAAKSSKSEKSEAAKPAPAKSESKPADTAPSAK